MKGKPEASGMRPTLTRSEAFAFAAVLALFTAGIFCVFLAAPRREFGQILRTNGKLFVPGHGP